MDRILLTVALLCSAPVCQAQSVTSLIDAYTPTSVLVSPATIPLGTTVVLVCRVGGVASGTQLSYTWTCPNGPCDVGEGNNPNRKTYGDRMVLNVLTSREEGMYTCLVREGQDAVHGSNYNLSVEGGTVLSSNNRLIPNNAIIFDNGADEDTNVGDILPPDNSSSVAVIDCSTDNSTQPLTWTDGAGQTVPTSPNLTVYQTTSGSSAALHIDTTDTSTFTNGRYQCDGGMARAVNIYINREGAVIPPPLLSIFIRLNSVARFVLTQATAARSERYISSLERTDLGVPLEVEFEETSSSGAVGDTIDRNVSAPGAVYNVKIWSINGASFSYDPVPATTTLQFDTVPSVPRLLSVTRILSDGFELNWLPPREPNGRPQYEIEYGTDDTNFTTVDTGSGDTYYNLTGLQHNTTYYIRVLAVNYITFNGAPLRGNESETVSGIIIPEPGLSTTSSMSTVEPTGDLTPTDAATAPPTTSGIPSPMPTSTVTQGQAPTSVTMPPPTSSPPSTTSTSTATQGQTPTSVATSQSTSSPPSTTSTSTTTQGQTPTSVAMPSPTSSPPSTTSTSTTTQGQTPTSVAMPPPTSSPPSTTSTSTATQGQTPTSMAMSQSTSSPPSTTFTSTVTTEASTTNNTSTVEPTGRPLPTDAATPPTTSGTPSPMLASTMTQEQTPTSMAASPATSSPLPTIPTSTLTPARGPSTTSSTSTVEATGEPTPTDATTALPSSHAPSTTSTSTVTLATGLSTTSSTSTVEPTGDLTSTDVATPPPTSSTPSPTPTITVTQSIDILPIIIPVVVVVFICALLIVLLIGSIICCVGRRRQKEVDHHEKGDIPLEGYYNVDAGENAKNAEVNHSTGEYTYIATSSPSSDENEDQTAPYASVNDVVDEKGSRDRLNNSCDRLTASTDKLDTAYAMLNAADDEISDTEVFENEHAYDVAQRTSDIQPAMYSEHGEKRNSAEYATVEVDPHSATHTPLLSSQDYTTIPEKEPAEELYDTVDTAPQNEDTPATPLAADYASIVETAQEGADDTEQPPPVPAFDPEILYTQPDKTSKAKDGGYETVPETPGPAAVGEYEPVGMPHTSTEKQTKVPSPTRAHCETPDFGYDTVPDTSGPVAEAGYEAVDIPRTNTVAARVAEARNLSDKPPTYRTGQPKDSVYETVSDSTLPPPVDVSPSYEAVHYSPNPYPAQRRTPPAQPKGSDANTLYAEPERTVEQRVAKDKADGYATVNDTTSKGAKTEQPTCADGLYSTPDMSQKKNRWGGSQGAVGGEGPKDMPPGTPTVVAKDKADGYATVDDTTSKGIKPEQPACADGLYSTPEMSKKKNRRRGSQGAVGGEGPKDMPPGSPTVVAKDKADGYATVDDKTSKGAKTEQPTCADGLYSTPDMSQKNRWRGSQGSVGGEGPKDMPLGTPTAVAKDKADGYATVDDTTSKGAKTEQPTCADGLYSTPDMSQKNRRTRTQGSVGGEGHKNTPLGTPTVADHLNATPDMSKKQRKQSHMSNGIPLEEQQGRDDED